MKAEKLYILKDLLFGNNILHAQGKSILIQTFTNKYDLLHKMHFNIRAQTWQVLKDWVLHKLKVLITFQDQPLTSVSP